MQSSAIDAPRPARAWRARAASARSRASRGPRGRPARSRRSVCRDRCRATSASSIGVTGCRAITGCRSSRLTRRPGRRRRGCRRPGSGASAARRPGSASRRCGMTGEREVDRPADRADLGRGIERRAHLVVGDRRSEAARASAKAAGRCASIQSGPCARAVLAMPMPRSAREARELLRASAGRGTAPTGRPAKVSTSITAAEPVKSSPYQATSRPSGRPGASSPVLVERVRPLQVRVHRRRGAARRRAPRWHRRSPACSASVMSSCPDQISRSEWKRNSQPSIAWLTAERMRLPESRGDAHVEGDVGAG